MHLSFSWVCCLNADYDAVVLMWTEVNPQLFDDCTHEYGAQQNAQVQKKSDRKARWDRVEQLALARKGAKSEGPHSTPLTRVEEGDPLENQRRMEALRLQDDGHRSSSVSQ